MEGWKDGRMEGWKDGRMPPAAELSCPHLVKVPEDDAMTPRLTIFAASHEARLPSIFIEGSRKLGSRRREEALALCRGRTR